MGTHTRLGNAHRAMWTQITDTRTFIGQNTMNEYTNIFRLCALDFTIPLRRKHNHSHNDNRKKLIDHFFMIMIIFYKHLYYYIFRRFHQELNNINAPYE